MSNPFTGIITSEFKTIHTQMISSLISSCSHPCTIKYGVTKWETCENCSGSGIGNKQSNTNLPGGNIPFHQGQNCSACGGDGKRPVESTESISLVVTFDYKRFIGGPVANPEGKVEIFTLMSNVDKLRQAKEIIINSNITGYKEQVAIRDSDFSPCGFDHDFCTSIWKLVK